MTWLRWDTDAAFSDVVGDLVADVKVPPSQAFGLYVATCLGFGQHRPDGRVSDVNDPTLEGWARWTGKPGRWAAAFRARCADDNGVIRGWWRNAAVLRKQAKDRSRPPSHLRDSPAIPPGEPPTFPQDSPAGGRRTETEDVDETISSSLPGRLLTKLVGHPARYAITGFLETLPDGQSFNTWALCLNGCLEGLGLEQGRKATVEELAAACNDYRATPSASWGIPHFRSFVDRVVAKRFRPVRSRSGKTEAQVDAATAWVNRKAAEPEPAA